MDLPSVYKWRLLLIGQAAWSGSIGTARTLLLISSAVQSCLKLLGGLALWTHYCLEQLGSSTLELSLEPDVLFRLLSGQTFGAALALGHSAASLLIADQKSMRLLPRTVTYLRNRAFPHHRQGLKLIDHKTIIRASSLERAPNGAVLTALGLDLQHRLTIVKLGKVKEGVQPADRMRLSGYCLLHRL